MSYLVDSHCHLDFDDFKDEGVEIIIQRARNNNIGHMVTICTHVNQFEERILQTALKSEYVDCTVGTHPHHADEEKHITKDILLKYAQHPKVIGIGETGLDYYYDTSSRAQQHLSFRQHIQVAMETDLPLVIHARDADDDIISIFKEETNGQPCRAVLHCFSSSRALAMAGLELGMYVSLAGIITFKNAEDIRLTVKDVPLERLLVETDSPYLAPIPMRGKRNEPSFVRYTADFIADLKNIDKALFYQKTTDNFYTLFSKAQRKPWPIQN